MSYREVIFEKLIKGRHSVVRAVLEDMGYSPAKALTAAVRANMSLHHKGMAGDFAGIRVAFEGFTLFTYTSTILQDGERMIRYKQQWLANSYPYLSTQQPKRKT